MAATSAAHVGVGSHEQPAAVTEGVRVQVSAAVRYGMLVQCFERLWGTAGAAHDEDTTDVLYDGLLQQLEARMLRLHRLMLDLGVSRLPADGVLRPPCDPVSQILGRVTCLPCEVRTSAEFLYSYHTLQERLPQVTGRCPTPVWFSFLGCCDGASP